MEDLNLLNPRDVQKILKCSLPLIYKLAEQGRIPHIRIPCPGDGERKKSLVRFKKEDVLAFIDRFYNKN